MNFTGLINKKIPVLIAVSLLSLNFLFLILPYKSNAQFAVSVIANTDPGTIGFYTASAAYYSGSTANQTAQTTHDLAWTEIAKPALDKLLQQLAKTAARELIQKITDATVNWINSGFNGNPAFIANPGDFLAQTADQAVGSFIQNDPNLRFLCSPFQIQVKLALYTNYSTTAFNQINCTASGALTNLENGTFSWNDWLQVASQPQNTPTGAYLLAQGQLEAQIANKQGAVSNDINLGSGAISYKSCTDSVYQLDSKGNITNSSNPVTFTYTGSDLYPNSATQNYLAQNKSKILTVKTSCTVKTPGTTIATMLGFKATSEQRTDEIGAALSNGIDAVLSSLSNQLIKLASDQLTNGVLANNSTNSSNYNSSLNNLASQAQNDYNGSITNANSAASNVSSNAGTNSSGMNLDTGVLGSYDNTFGSGFSTGFTSVSGGSSLGGTTNNINDCLSSIKQQYITKINSLVSGENSYQTGISGLLQTLSDSKASFATARSCNLTQNDSNSILRAQLIYQNAIENIDGITDSGRSIPSIIWNTPYLNNLIMNSNNNITLLNAAEDAVNAATSTDGLTAAVNPILPPVIFNDPNTLGTTTSGLTAVNSLTTNNTVLKNQQILSSTQGAPDTVANTIATAAGSAGLGQNSSLTLPSGMLLTVPCGFLCLSAPTNQPVVNPGSSISLNDLIVKLIQLKLQFPGGATVNISGGITAQIPTSVPACSTVTTNSSKTSGGSVFGLGNKTNNTSGGGSVGGFNMPTDNSDGLKNFLSSLQNIYTTASCPINLGL